MKSSRYLRDCHKANIVFQWQTNNLLTMGKHYVRRVTEIVKDVVSCYKYILCSCERSKVARNIDLVNDSVVDR